MEKNTFFYGFSEMDLNGYVQGTISDETRQAMELAIQQHPDLKTELIQRIHLDRIQRDSAALLWLAKTNYKRVPFTKLNWHQSIFVRGVAGMLVCALSIGAFWVHTSKRSLYEHDAQVSAKAVALVRESLEVPKGEDFFSDTSSNVSLKQALTLYRNKDYEKAEPLLIRLRPLLQEEAIEIYIGICRLQRGHFKEARQVLYPLLVEQGSDNSSYQAETRWYLSLALIAEPNPMNLEQARAYLHEIPTNSPYKGDTDELLDKIKILY